VARSKDLLLAKLDTMLQSTPFPLCLVWKVSHRACTEEPPPDFSRITPSSADVSTDLIGSPYGAMNMYIDKLETGDQLSVSHKAVARGCLDSPPDSCVLDCAFS
jgi:hypothetical protein